MTELRKRLRTVSSKNKALQDILRSCLEADSILSVETHKGPVHNTQLTLLLPNGEKRVHFYNRVLLENTIPEGFISSGLLDLDIEILNTLYGCDFTEDDLQMVCGKFVAKPTSIGYYSKEGAGQGSNLPADKVGFNLAYGSALNQRSYFLSLRIKRFTAGDDVPQVIILDSDDQHYTGYSNHPVDFLPTFNTIDLPDWLKATPINYQWQSNDSFFSRKAIELENQTTDIVEVAVVLVTYSEDGIRLLTSATALLTNSRLMAKGSTLPYCPLSDTLYFKETDFVNWDNGVYDLYNQNTEITAPYIGQYNGVNGAVKDSWWIEEVPDAVVFGFPEGWDQPLDPVFEHSPNLGNLRIFKEIVSSFQGSVTTGHEPTESVMPPLSTTKMIVANRFATPLMVEDKAFLRPLQFTPNKHRYLPDELFQPIMQSGGDLKSEWFLGNCRLAIKEMDANGQPVTSPGAIDLEFDLDEQYDSINRLHQDEPTLRQMLDLSLMVENASQVVLLYVKNLTDKRLGIALEDGGDGGEVLKLAAILEPLNTAPVVVPDTVKDLSEFLYTDAPETDMGPLSFELKYRGVTFNNRRYMSDALQYKEGSDYNTEKSKLWARSIYPELVHIKATWDIGGGELVSVEGDYVLRPELLGEYWFPPS